MLWWCWGGYAWLTSVVDPEEGTFASSSSPPWPRSSVVALCVPEAFDDLGLIFALSYGVVRTAHIGLFIVASRDDPGLRRSTLGLAGGTAVGVGLLVDRVVLRRLGPRRRCGSWPSRSTWPSRFFFGAEGWQLVPEHFAERYGLIVIVALGESIVAIGIGAEAGVDAGVIVAAVLGVTLVAAMWWLYFDVVALVAVRRLAARSPPGREQNEMARDSYSYLHFPMVAGIVLVALGLKTTIAHVDEPLEQVAGGRPVRWAGAVPAGSRGVPAFATCTRLNAPRLGLAVAAPGRRPRGRLGRTPWSRSASWRCALALLVAYEVVRYAEARDRIRHAPAEG